jgi:hypothetical protein
MPLVGEKHYNLNSSSSISAISIAGALMRIHPRQCRIIRPNKVCIIVHCSTSSQVAKFVEMDKIGNTSVQVEQYQQTQKLHNLKVATKIQRNRENETCIQLLPQLLAYHNQLN